tara:strand:+ start:1761 stop:2009 length:249 start_codon:yes stop_codon:yes gene_type:complete
MENKNDTPVVKVGDKELEYSELSDNSKYYHNQLLDLIEKRSKLQFQLDQINMSVKGFETLFIESTKETIEEKTEEVENELAN